MLPEAWMTVCAMCAKWLKWSLCLVYTRRHNTNTRAHERSCYKSSKNLNWMRIQSGAETEPENVRCLILGVVCDRAQMSTRGVRRQARETSCEVENFPTGGRAASNGKRQWDKAAKQHASQFFFYGPVLNTALMIIRHSRLQDTHSDVVANENILSYESQSVVIIKQRAVWINIFGEKQSLLTVLALTYSFL